MPWQLLLQHVEKLDLRHLAMSCVECSVQQHHGRLSFLEPHFPSLLMRLSHSVTSALIFSAVYEVRSLSMERVKARISTNVTTLFYTLGMFIDVVTT